jgi:hypothetical protein
MRNCGNENAQERKIFCRVIRTISFKEKITGLIHLATAATADAERRTKIHFVVGMGVI